MPQVNIPLTDDQKSQIKDAMGVEFDSLTVESIDDQAASELDLSVEELEDRVNPAIEAGPPPCEIQGQMAQGIQGQVSQRIQPGVIYLGMTSGKNLLMHASPRR